MSIQYTIKDNTIGRHIVASSEKGRCMVSNAKTDKELERKIHDQFPSESVTRDDRAVRALAADVRSRIEGKNLDVKVPLDLRGTPFQMDVWKEMLKIRAGSVRSYGDVAKRIGKPNAFRAVAQACGANPVPVVVPCHRVVASGGKLGGFGLGLDRKISLLAAEGVSDPKWNSGG
jgi:AraC family transcriptional regulator of adaptative response/methylated-DNA-[protein]-cysteine methyltransferase